MGPPRADSPPNFHPLQSFAPHPQPCPTPARTPSALGLGSGVSGGLFHLLITQPSWREIRQRESRQWESFCRLDRLCTSLAAASQRGWISISCRVLWGWGHEGRCKAGENGFHPSLGQFHLFTKKKKGYLFSCCNSQGETGTTGDISKDPVFFQTWSPEKRFAPGQSQGLLSSDFISSLPFALS